jgi:hypothetical protein
MDKVIEKREQHSDFCKMLVEEGYDVVLLPVVLESTGILFKCLDRATKRWTLLTLERRNYTASLSFAYTVYTVHRI